MKKFGISLFGGFAAFFATMAAISFFQGRISAMWVFLIFAGFSVINVMVTRSIDRMHQKQLQMRRDYEYLKQLLKTHVGLKEKALDFLQNRSRRTLERDHLEDQMAANQMEINRLLEKLKHYLN